MTHAMLANETRFADGLSPRDDLTNEELSPEFPEDMIHYEIPDELRVVDPTAQ